MLYQEYLEAKGAWQTEREGLVQERAGLLAQREQDQLQLQEFKVIICVESGPLVAYVWNLDPW